MAFAGIKPRSLLETSYKVNAFLLFAHSLLTKPEATSLSEIWTCLDFRHSLYLLPEFWKFWVLIGNFRKIRSLYFNVFFLEGNKIASLPIYQWQAAAKAAQHFDPYLWQNYWKIHVFLPKYNLLTNINTFFWNLRTEFYIEFLIFGPFGQQPALI